MIVIEGGEGSLVLDGELVDRKKPGAADYETGTAIRNGVEYKVSVGDVFYVPAETPHQYLVQPGKQLTHFTLNE